MKKPHNSRATAAVAIAAAAALGTILVLNTIAPSSQPISTLFVLNYKQLLEVGSKK
jgi:hypothetical protein